MRCELLAKWCERMEAEMLEALTSLEERLLRLESRIHQLEISLHGSDTNLPQDTDLCLDQLD